MQKYTSFQISSILKGAVLMYWPQTNNASSSSSLVTESNSFCCQFKSYVDINPTLTLVPYGTDRQMMAFFKHESNPFSLGVGTENGKYLGRCTTLYAKFTNPNAQLIGFNQVWAWYDGQYTYIGLNVHSPSIQTDRYDYVNFDITIPLSTAV